MSAFVKQLSDYNSQVRFRDLEFTVTIERLLWLGSGVYIFVSVSVAAKANQPNKAA